MPRALITGAAKGLGRALSRCFAGHGWDLSLVVRSPNSKADLLKEFPKSSVLVSDITHREHESRLRDWLGDIAIDVLINNAGSGSKGPTLTSATTAQLSTAFETNCLGVFATVRGAYNSLHRASSALVLNISSRRGSLSMQAQGSAKNSGCSYSYRISKAAQNMLTLCLADDLEEDGISVAAIHPGRLLTEMASKDANMPAEKSAALITARILNGEIKNRDYLCMETGSLQW